MFVVRFTNNQEASQGAAAAAAATVTAATITDKDTLATAAGAVNALGVASSLWLDETSLVWDEERKNSLSALFDTHSVWVTIRNISGAEDSTNDLLKSIIAVLDAGAAKVVLDISSNQIQLAKYLSVVLPELPLERILVKLQVDGVALENVEGIINQLRPAVSGFVFSLLWDNVSIETESEQSKLVKNLSALTGGKNQSRQVIVQLPKIAPSLSTLGALAKTEIDYVLNVEAFTSKKLDAGEALAACLVTDRPDGLFTTVVVDEQRVALGLAYSSAKSLSETIRTGQGVYQSRTRGLWYKGLTSGATQAIKRISFDCDRDTIQFVVAQSGPGFCHFNTKTCFGSGSGISGLFDLLQSRKISSPPKSYTRRLFEDKSLLRSKIIEEANELCDAETPDDVAWEAADLIYFALVKCVSAGASLADIEKHLERRSKKVTRRPGNAKPQFANSEASTSGAAAKEAEKPSASVTVPPAKPEIKMKSYMLKNLSKSEATALLQRPVINSDEIFARVQPIVKDVAARGDDAVKDLTAKFDGVKLESCVVKAPFDESLMQVDPKVKAAIDQAYENIYQFHKAQLDTTALTVETMPGVVCSRFVRPIERVGLYVPGGTAVLPSSTLMLGVPAKVAGCSEIVIASPPRKDGKPVPEVVYVAHKVGASTIVLAGGAQAVAAMAYGSKSVPKVDKIVGPGNQYVTAGKMLLQNDIKAMISIDMPAGPSELLVIADANSNPAYVASDLLSQAEHGGDSQVVLVAVNLPADHLARIEQEVKQQGEALPRSDIVRISIPKSYILEVDSMKEAIEFSNSYAPEHLILHIDNAESVVKDVMHAGSVFVGKWSPESCGDYASGTNHTLPTYGYAKMYSGVNTATFVKYITSQTLSKEGLNKIGDTVTTLAEIEGLEAHRNAVAIRLKDIRA